MIQNHDMRVIRVIEKATEHNRKVYLLIKEIYRDAIKHNMKQINCSEEEAERMLGHFIRFYHSCDVVKTYCYGSDRRIVGNVIRANIEVPNVEIMHSLAGLNSSYDIVQSAAKEDR